MKMFANIIKIINYISIILYVWVITLILTVLIKYGLDYSTKVADPKFMDLGILYSFFPFIYLILNLILIPVNLLLSIIYVLIRKNIFQENLIFIIIHCISLIMYYWSKNTYGLIFWLFD